MREAVIVSTARTAMTKAGRGALNDTHGIKMAGHAIKGAIERAGIEWTKEILFQMMKLHNINPTQAEDLIKLFCAGMPNDNHALCEMCGFPAIDEDAKLAKEATKECVDKYEELLRRCGDENDESERDAIRRSMGLKIEQLKAEARLIDE